MRATLRRGAILGAMLAAAACSNAGEGRFFAITATGVVFGTAYMDVDGSRSFTSGDTALSGVRVVLRTSTGDSVKSVFVPSSGQYRIDSIPVGRYLVSIDSASLGPELEVAKLDSTAVTIQPQDSSLVNVGIGYPHVTIAQARALVAGRRVFVEGVILHNVGIFRDTTVSIQDATDAIRMERLRTPNLFAGDSVRVFGLTFRRDNQPVLRDVTATTLGSTFLPSVVDLTTLVASNAQGGVRDAELVRVTHAIISDTATAGQDTRLTVSDSSGDLEVLLEGTADAAFAPGNLPFGIYQPTKKFTIIGILVPTGVANVWRLKPRSSTDLTLEP